MAKAKRRARVAAKPRARGKSVPKALHAVRFPNESAGYRKARNALLKAEIGLRRQVERVAALRRKLPAGGRVPEDYVFEEGARDLTDTQTVRRVRLSELFGDKDTLVVYSYMYGPKMEKPCPMCTAILDALNSSAEHVGQRVAFVAIAKSPIVRIREVARARGWSQLRILSSAANSFNRDYRGEDGDDQRPVLNVFVRRDENIQHFFATEMLFAAPDPGQNHRHVDMIWPLWNLFDFTPAGRGKDWYPKLSYAG